MKIAIRKEFDGSFYFDSTALNRFSEKELMLPPYNYTFTEVPFDDFSSEDFNDDFSFSDEKYNNRKMMEQKQKLREWRQPYLNMLDRATWFYSLTDEQKAQAVEFRQKLLDITSTMVIPVIPDFIQISGV